MGKITVKSSFKKLIRSKPTAAVILAAAIILIAGMAFASSTTAEPTFKSQTKLSNQWETVVMRVTAYCPCGKCCGKYSDGNTASGHKIRRADVFVAADKKYSFDTEIIVPGYNNGESVKVLDRGSAIYGNRLDVFFNSHKTALKWGVKHLEVKLRCK